MHCYAGFVLQLFDLDSDPLEQNDLGQSAGHGDTRERLHARLCREFGDPQAISDLAFSDQARRIEALGGVDGIYARKNFDHRRSNPMDLQAMLAHPVGKVSNAAVFFFSPIDVLM